jgi:hypothetical protein
VTAAGLAAEVGDFHRFATAGKFMAFVGLVPCEHSTGAKRRQGGITKSGNRHLRRLLIEAGWHYYRTPLRVSADLKARREGVPQAVIDIADKALHRLGHKSYQMKQGAKAPNKIVTALAREFAGFLLSNVRMRTTPGGKPRQRSDAPLAHRRPGPVVWDRALSGCVPAEPDSASPGTLTVPRLNACRNHSWTSEPCLGKSHPHSEVRAT